jgi:uncharacterized protein (TIGR01777 family)
MKYLITGGTGLVGRKLVPALLDAGHEVHNLGRKAVSGGRPGLVHHRWDGKAVPGEVPAVDVVVNLAGASIGQPWSAAYKKLLVSSRVDATLACADFLRRKPLPGQVFLSASGYNYYGDLLEAPVNEASPAGGGFMSGICRQWEAASAGTGARTVQMRMAVVLDREDGALARMLTPYRFFLGGPLGSGSQGFPWIHVDDLVAGILFLAGNEAISGPVNLVAPQAVRQSEFAQALGGVMRRPSFFQLPRWVLERVFGEMSVILWGGAFVEPGVLKAAGFQWKHPEIKEALQDLLG